MTGLADHLEKLDIEDECSIWWDNTARATRTWEHSDDIQNTELMAYRRPWLKGS